MRVFVILAVLTTACAAPAPTFELTEARRAELLEAREAVWRSWFSHDTLRLRELLPENLIAIPPAGDAWQSRTMTMTESRGFTLAGGKLVALAFPRTEIQSFGPVAVIYSSYRFETELGGRRDTLQGRVTEVFEFRDGRWVNPSWHMDDDP